ncbi:hypothetical protein M0R45_029809 [Rubus argutus]|uniref:F-box domain-containing protein n=1 Tax=Rubus argutus TaxID=59490 RepID=A0AAW1W978_RUBAR
MATPLETSPEVDRFSNLPNEIAHHLLSLLSFKDFTRVGCVSKRCRRLHLSAPSIKFCEFSDVTNISSCDVHKRLLDSFDRFLNQRGDNKIRSFHFSWCFRSLSGILEDEGMPNCYCDDIRLNAWIDNAVRCNVEVVQIVNSAPDWYHRLPSSLLLCQSLRSLLVDGKAYIGREVTSSTFSNLEYLELKNVMIENDKEFWKWVSYSCKCIKDLHLEGVSGGKDIIIDSSSLESFSFKSLFIHSARADSCNLNISGDRLEKINIKRVARDSSIMISAPNLKRLCCHGSFARQHNFGELPCLEIADISADSFFNKVNHLALFGLLCSIPRVEVLILSEPIVKAVLEQGFMSVQLDCVRYLRLIHLVLTDDLIPALIALLGVMPNLSCLYIKSMPTTRCEESNCAGFDMEFWKVQNLAFIDKIKEVTLDICHGSNVLEFARYILEHAQNLEKVVLYHFPDQCDDVKKLQSQMISNPIVLLHQ